MPFISRPFPMVRPTAYSARSHRYPNNFVEAVAGRCSVCCQGRVDRAPLTFNRAHKNATTQDLTRRKVITRREHQRTCQPRRKNQCLFVGSKVSSSVPCSSREGDAGAWQPASLLVSPRTGSNREDQGHEICAEWDDY